MKIRSGFVSNSSSSSFCILGVETTSEIFYKIDQIPYSERTPTTLDNESNISSEGTYYIGYAPEKMKDNETLSEFKDRIVSEASALGISIDRQHISWYTDGGYNG